MPKGVYKRVIPVWNKGTYGEKIKNFKIGLQNLCKTHGLHSNWSYNEKWKQIVCKFCEKDRRIKYEESDEYVFKKYIIWAKARCAKTKKEFNLDVEYIAQLYLDQKGLCALSGIELDEVNLSLDRIDSSKGYTKDNVQWLDFDVNRMKTDLDQDKFIELCTKIHSLFAKTKKK